MSDSYAGVKHQEQNGVKLAVYLERIAQEEQSLQIKNLLNYKLL